VNIVTTYFCNIIITTKSFVFSIKDKVFLVEVGIANTTLILKEVYSSLMLLVLRMLEPCPEG
jgi:hypothetical protein